MNRFLTYAFAVLSTLAGLILLWELRLAVVLFLLSLAIGGATRPAVDFFIQRGLKRGLAILITYGLGLILIIGLLLMISQPLLIDLQELSDDLLLRYEQLVVNWRAGSSFQKMIADQLPPSRELYEAFTGEQGSQLVQRVVGVAQGLGEFSGYLFIVVILSMYWSADQLRFERLWLSLLPANRRARARAIWRAIESGVGAYIRSEFIQTILAGLLLGTGYALIGLRYPVLTAFIGALLWLIPWLGVVLAVIVAALIGLMDAPLIAAAAGGLTLVVLILLESFLEPRFLNRRRYSSLLVIIMVIALADSFGLAGLVMAPPLAAAIQILFNSTVRTPGPVETVSPVTQILTLQNKLEALRKEAEETGIPSPEVTNLINRLEKLMEEAEEVLEKDDIEIPTLGLPVSPDAPS